MVTAAWNDIFESQIGSKGLKIGVDIFPSGQVMGALLHELIPREFADAHPTLWRPEIAATDKDIVFIPDDKFSIELKTSSDPSQILETRVMPRTTTDGKKLKDGYYLVVNYEKFEPGKTAQHKEDSIWLARSWRLADRKINNRTKRNGQSHCQEAQTYITSPVTPKA
jgi:hypothetical protein